MFKPEFSISNPLSKEEALNINPSSLALIGDAVQALYLRTDGGLNSTDKTGKIHNRVTQCVKATTQAKVMNKLIDTLDEDELSLFKKARNLKILTSAKHATIDEYRYATGFEALLGFYFITNNYEKLIKFILATTED